MDLSFFQYSDFDLSPSGSSDSVEYTTDIFNRLVFKQWSECLGVSESTQTPGPDAYEVGFSSNVLSRLTDSTADTLSGTAGPVSGNVAWAAQWNRTLSPSGPGRTFIISKTKSIGVTNMVSIGNYVWQDLNHNGIQDEGPASGMNDVTVRLLDCQGAPVLDASLNPITTVTSNDENSNPGYYYFVNLSPGCYRVAFDKPNGFSFSPRNAPGSTAANDSDADPDTGITGDINLTCGASDFTIDAGLYAPEGPGCIKVTSEISAIRAEECCADYCKFADGYLGDQQAGFCYRITVTNCGPLTLSNVTVVDNRLGDLTLFFFPGPGSVLEPGASLTQVFRRGWSVNTTNTVTATGQTVDPTGTATASDTTVALVDPTSISTTVIITAPCDLDGNSTNNHVTLPFNAGCPVTFTVRITNNGPASVSNVVLSVPAFGALGCDVPAPFMLASGDWREFQCQASFVSTNLPFSITATAIGDVLFDSIHGNADTNCVIIHVSSTGTGLAEQATTPCVEVQSRIASVLVGGACGAFGDIAAGFLGQQEPGFCYEITVRNCGSLVLSNLTVLDNRLGNLTTSFFPTPETTLAPGASVTQVFKRGWNANTTNTVTAAGQSVPGGTPVSSTDSTVALVDPAGITTTLIITSPCDQDGSLSDNHVLLPPNTACPVTFTIHVCNTGRGDLSSVTLVSPTLSGLGCPPPAPFSLAGYQCLDFPCTVTVNSSNPPPVIVVGGSGNTVPDDTHGNADTNGNIVTVTNSGNGSVEVTPTCTGVTVLSATTNRLSLQTGCFEQFVTLTNDCPSAVAAVRLDVHGLPPTTYMPYAWGTNAGVPYVILNQPLPGHSSVTLFLEYFSPTWTIPNATFTVAPTNVVTLPTYAGTVVTNLTPSVGDAGIVLRFKTTPGKKYAISYGPLSSFPTNLTATPTVIKAAGKSVFWIDGGPPKTDLHPAEVPGFRGYRVVELP